jgi:3-dehydroquinate synthase
MVEIRQSFQVSYAYAVRFTRGAFAPDNPVLRDLLLEAGPGPHRVLPVLDSGVAEAQPSLAASLRAYAAAHPGAITLVADPLVVRGGETAKSDPVAVAALHGLVAEHEICRHSFILAIGGGAVLDAAGYAAATAHRGVRVVRMPTTVLAQNDAGIGVKNGVNWDGRKNFLGTFTPPFAVINDFDFLATLGERDKRAGIAEALKVALIRDADLFERLHDQRQALAAFEPAAMEEMIVRCAELHLAHIRSSGDPFELGSARPLDFGHWAAHGLEELSGGELRHGEAVAVGVALDSVYSQRTGRIGENDLHAILMTLEGIGFRLAHPLLAELDVRTSLDRFREHLGGDLTITLLRGIGRGVEVHEIDLDVMRKCIDFLRHRGRQRPSGDRQRSR